MIIKRIRRLMRQLEEGECICSDGSAIEDTSAYIEMKEALGKYKFGESTVDIPNTIRIGSMNYYVNRTSSPLILDNRQCFGTIDYNHKQICIDESVQDAQGCEQTLLHEMFHGAIREHNINIDGIDEEMLVESFARALHQIIKDNKEMFY